MKFSKILNFILLLPILCACNENAIYERAYNYLMKMKGQLVETTYTDNMGNKRKGRTLNLKKLPKKCAFEIENGDIARTLNINSNRIQKIILR